MRISGRSSSASRRAHREPAVAALTRGLPLYLEKPIARTAEDAAEIVAVAKGTGTVCAVGYQWHALDLLDDLPPLLAGQQIGLLLGTSIGPTRAARGSWTCARAAGTCSSVAATTWTWPGPWGAR